MKKMYTVLLSAIILLSIQSNAQPNYLFFASSKTYQPVTGGTIPHLIENSLRLQITDEGFAENIPIGFTFRYDDKNYSKVNINVNGFVTLGDTFTTRETAPNFINSLSRGPQGFGGERPVIAPLWDDLALFDTSDLVYKTNGSFPFKVFTVEWKKIRWTSNDSTYPVLSFELKLYETTNVIEFNYKDEGGLPYASKAFASIGITSADYNRDFISVLNSSSHPDISLTRANDSISAKPENNQVYRFVPGLAAIPNPFHSSISYTDEKVSFKLQSGGFNGYDYAVTKSPIPPAAGIKTFSSNVIVSSLSAATTYYIYARSNWFNLFYSQWVCDSFTTAVKPEALPYHLSGNPDIYPYLPADMRIQALNDTSHNYFPKTDDDWSDDDNVDFPDIGDTTLWALNTLDGLNGNNWVFTPGLKLTAGETYQLKFGYASYWIFTPGAISSVEVKYGNASGAVGMNSGLLFKDTDIYNLDFPVLTDTIIEIKPSHTGVYYFGFHNMTSDFGAVPLIGNISILEKNSFLKSLIALSGKAINSGNMLSWSKINKNNLELQRSNDGTHFSKIKIANNQNNIKGNSLDINALQKEETAFDANLTNKPKSDYEKAFPKSCLINLNKRVIENANDANSKNNSLFNYTDENAQGINYYRLRCTDKNGIVSYSNIVRLETLVGVSIYPNPVSNILNIQFTGRDDNITELTVTNAAGELFIKKTTLAGYNKNLMQLNVSGLRPGAYFLNLFAKDGSLQAVEKFIKQ